MKSILLVLTMQVLTFNLHAQPIPIFDSHSHYSLADSQSFTPNEILKQLRDNHIIGALITSTPPILAKKLQQASNDLPIIPFYSLYPFKKHKPIWMNELDRMYKIEKELKDFQGIGEFHIFKKDTYSPALKKVVETAQKHQLKMLIHGDAEIIDRVFRLTPDAIIIWAHLGTRPNPEFLQRMLERYPKNLYIDTSVRDGLFVDEKTLQLKAEWKGFFIKNQNRMLAAIDTYSTYRWQNLDKAVNKVRLWLNQLPKDVATKIAYQNAISLFLDLKACQASATLSAQNLCAKDPHP